MAKKKASLGFLFWIAFILLILVVFLFNKSRIENVLDSTGFVKVVQNKIGTDAQPEVKVTPLQEPGKETGVSSEPGESEPVVPVPDSEPEKKSPVNSDNPTVETTPGPDKLVGTTTRKTVPEKEPEPRTKAPAAETKTAPKITSTSRTVPKPSAPSDTPAKPADTKTRKSRLFFVLVGDDGHINLKGAERTVTYSDSPLISTLTTLLSGPNRKDISDGLMSLIPDSTKLISASVKDGIAYLNFNEAFRFNKLGMDGYLAQLKQIVYSATEFPTVKKVQFLIEGEKLQYLTAEGIFIGVPLDRNSF